MPAQTRKLLIAPSILSADLLRLGAEVKGIEEAGADLIHVDVMDGAFVPNITMGASIVERLAGITNLPLDVHLMIERPEVHVRSFAQAGASFITVHQEVSPHLMRTLALIRGLNKKAGVAINPGTPVSAIEEVWREADLILVMTVNPGFANQSLIMKTLDKVREVRDLVGNLASPPLVEVDGGVKAENAHLFVKAGADILVAGSGIFSQKGKYRETMEAMRHSSDRD